MIQIDMEKPSACRWTDDENNIHLCPFLDREFNCLIQGHIGYWSWDGQYKNCPLHEVITDPDTVSRQAVLDSVDTITKWSLLDRNGCHVGVGMKYRDVKETVKSLPPSPSRPHIASLETPCDDCDGVDKCTYESNCPREAIWKAEHEGERHDSD